MQKTATLTAYRKNLREKILQTSMEEFKKHGIKAVKMDDIANLLSISKRTLYEIYANKEQLLLEGVKAFEGRYDSYMEQFADDPEHNVIDIFIEFYNKQIELFSNVKLEYMLEVDRYPLVVEYVEKRHAERRAYSMQYFRRGEREGYFRSDVDFVLVEEVCTMAMERVMQEGLYKKYDVRHILHTIVLLFIRGICTKEGIERLDAMLFDVKT